MTKTEPTPEPEPVDTATVEATKEVAEAAEALGLPTGPETTDIPHGGVAIGVEVPDGN